MHLPFAHHDLRGGGVGHDEQETAFKIGLNFLDAGQVDEHITAGAKEEILGKGRLQLT